MLNDTAVSEEVLEFDGWTGQKLILAVKSTDGHLMIDARKWRPKLHGEGLYPTKKGLNLSCKEWLKAIDSIRTLAEANK